MNKALDQDIESKITAMKNKHELQNLPATIEFATGKVFTCTKT